MVKEAQKLIGFLLNPCNYPEKPQTISHLETHISHVFIGDDFVYKIKKPVNYGFLDFSTLKKRHVFCEKEIKLNSRLARNVYLSVQPIYRHNHEFSFTQRKGTAPVEYAVKMKRIPLDRLLFKLISEGKPLYKSLEDVGKVLARFHENIAPYKGRKYGGVESITGATEENFEQIRPFIPLTIDNKTYRQLMTYTRAFIAGHAHAFSARKRNGYIRDGHGDLHCQHICLENPPIIFDCIEFNEGFRIGDILEDIAFLFMDLEYRGRFDLSVRLHKSYFAHQAEALDDDLLRFYKVYRAVVRGKVEGLSARNMQGKSEKAKAVMRARDYFYLANYYINYFQQPFNPVVFMGLSGSGKSTIAKDFAPGAVILRSDEIRKEVAGIKKSNGHAYSPFEKGIYNPELTRRVYRIMLEKAIEHAKEGRKIIIDATYLRAYQRRDLYDTCITEGLNPFFVHCFAHESILRERIRNRIKLGTDASDADIRTLEHQIKHLEEPDELPCYRTLRINTEEVIHTIVSALREFL